MTVPHGLPTTRRHLFDPPEELGVLRPVSPMTYPDGHEGWLITGYSAARAVLADRRFSSRQELKHSPVALAAGEASSQPAPPGTISRSDPPEHTRYRKLLAGHFTVQRMRQLTPRIERIAEEHLDVMAQAGPPVDLVDAFALPIPSLVICELLGVDYRERARFQRDSAALFRVDSTAEDLATAVGGLVEIIQGVIERDRAEPGDDVFAGLVTGGELTDQELTTIGLTLLVAGHETTANMISLGTLALLRHPDQLATLRSDPSLVDNAVEELLRYLSVVQIGPVRAAMEDIELDGHLIKEGQVVTVSLPAANRDPARFDAPDRLDITREASGHLAFSHGIHQCLGQQLSRVEMRVAFPALLHRFPTLRLAVAEEKISFRTGSVVYGVDELPVAW